MNDSPIVFAASELPDELETMSDLRKLTVAIVGADSPSVARIDELIAAQGADKRVPTLLLPLFAQAIGATHAEHLSKTLTLAAYNEAIERLKKRTDAAIDAVRERMQARLAEVRV